MPGAPVNRCRRVLRCLVLGVAAFALTAARADAVGPCLTGPASDTIDGSMDGRPMTFDGFGGRSSVDFRLLKVKVRRGVHVIGLPVGPCSTPRFLPSTFSGFTTPLLDSRGRPALGHGVRFLGVVGGDLPQASVDARGLRWPGQLTVAPGQAGLISLRLRFDRAGAYRFGFDPKYDEHFAPPPDEAVPYDGPVLFPVPMAQINVTAQGPPEPGPGGIDHTVYRAGQHIDFGVSGSRRAELCTGAFLVKVGVQDAPVALSAGHCGRRGRRAFRGDQTGRRQVFGVVLASILSSRFPGSTDALVFSLAAPAAQEIERGQATPLKVTGWVPNHGQHRGMRICFAGRSSGADQCGTITRLRPGAKRCTTIHVRSGDSGGPVYLQSTTGATRAIGIVNASYSAFHSGMCYTPIETAMRVLDASWYDGP